MTQHQIETDQSDGLGGTGAGMGPEPEPHPEAEHSNTRQRILDAALDLFTEQGYDGTSLREIAAQLGVTKAALYYHFESKEDILRALHMRLHEVGRDALMRLGDENVTLELWGELLDPLVDQMLAQRQIFLLHQRNEAAIEKLHNEAHETEHEDIQRRLLLVLADPNLPLGDRVRMAASVGVLFSGLFLSGVAFASTSNDEMGRLLREILHDVLGRRPGRRLTEH
jgi:AcrR family transcriptional regulator